MQDRVKWGHPLMRQSIRHHRLKQLLQPPITFVKAVANVVNLNDQELTPLEEWNLDDLQLIFIFFELAAVDGVAWRIISLEWIENLVNIYWISLVKVKQLK
jgi:hypothetical protein